jgi:penicillin-binding protein 1C
VFIKAEDRRFYLHPGVDLIAVAGSAARNFRARHTVSGASTITMQLARLIRPRGKGMAGKITEAWDALKLEARLSKKQILELWLNGIPFGSNIEGLPAMARARFGRSVRELDDGRAALLAVVPRRPALYDPALNPESAAAAALVLSGRCGLDLSESAVAEAAAEAAAAVNPAAKAPFYAPHFSQRAAEQAMPGVWEMRTTLDLRLQSYAEERLVSQIAGLAGNRVGNGAILAIENGTGKVRIYTGSASWYSDEISGKIDAVRALNQPGSCLKPFLYAMALDSGFSPNSILPDIPTVFGSGEAYIPSNFNRRFNGPVRLRLALASSLNIPAVYMLERLGVQSFEEYLVSLGFDSIASRMGTHGTGLALGNAEVSLEELVRAFAAFPSGGKPAELTWIEDDSPRRPEDGGRIISPYAARLISDILSDRQSRFVGFGPAPALSTDFPSMFKTGTANQFQHIWALGASSRFTVGVWMGNLSGETVVGRTGSSIPARVCSDILKELENSAGGVYAGHVSAPIPDDCREVEVCALSGMAATRLCTGVLKEWIRPGSIPAPCNWHRGGASGGTALVYPPEYQAWIGERFRLGRVDAPGGKGNAIIRIPAQGSVFYFDSGLPAEAQALRVETAGFSSEALVYVDESLQGSVNQAGVYVLPLWKGKHVIVVEDSDGTAASVNIEVR